MNGWKVVSPEEAKIVMSGRWASNLAHTVATEPDRLRAEVVRALRDHAFLLLRRAETTASVTLYKAADVIENGADW